MVVNHLQGHSSALVLLRFLARFFFVLLFFSSTSKCPNGQAVKIEDLQYSIEAPHAQRCCTVVVFRSIRHRLDTRDAIPPGRVLPLVLYPSARSFPVVQSYDSVGQAYHS